MCRGDCLRRQPGGAIITNNDDPQQIDISQLPPGQAPCIPPLFVRAAQLCTSPDYLFLGNTSILIHLSRFKFWFWFLIFDLKRAKDTP
jgi:hypothetical protein